MIKNWQFLAAFKVNRKDISTNYQSCEFEIGDKVTILRDLLDYKGYIGEVVGIEYRPLYSAFFLYIFVDNYRWESNIPAAFNYGEIIYNLVCQEKELKAVTSITKQVLHKWLKPEK